MFGSAVRRTKPTSYRFQTVSDQICIYGAQETVAIRDDRLAIRRVFMIMDLYYIDKKLIIGASR